MKSPWPNVAITFIVATALLVFYFLVYQGLAREQGYRTEQMKACVAAGKSWVREGITDNYECK